LQDPILFELLPHSHNSSICNTDLFADSDVCCGLGPPSAQPRPVHASPRSWCRAGEVIIVETCHIGPEKIGIKQPLPEAVQRCPATKDEIVAELSPVSADARTPGQNRSQLDRLYHRVIDDLDALVQAVGLKAAA